MYQPDRFVVVVVIGLVRKAFKEAHPVLDDDHDQDHKESPTSQTSSSTLSSTKPSSSHSSTPELVEEDDSSGSELEDEQYDPFASKSGTPLTQRSSSDSSVHSQPSSSLMMSGRHVDGTCDCGVSVAGDCVVCRI